MEKEMTLMTTLNDLFKKFIRSKINPFVFKISEQPMRFQELMHANKIYNDGMNLEYNMTGFRIRLARVYLVFFILAMMIVIPPSAVFHSHLAKIDCHALIILSIVSTVLLFSTFALFKSWLIEQVSKQLIIEAWKNHFPHFDYIKNTQKVSHIYAEAQENGIKSKDLQRYIITAMVSED